MSNDEHKDHLTFKRWSLSLQYVASFLFVPIAYLIIWFSGKFILKFRVKNKRALRRQFKQIIKNCDGPLLVCPNHLTYIDSPIIQISIASIWTYLTRFYSCTWNLPKKSNVQTSRFFQVMCYLGKCILLPNKGNNHQINLAMNKIKYLLQKGEYIMLFPEGTRSVSGRFNDQEFGYGVGQLLEKVPTAKVLCVYMRGEKQLKKSNFPAKGDKISITLKLIDPKTTETGRRASRDLSRQIIKTIAKMEQDYFKQ